MAEGLYRIGDYVYMEVHPSPQPYQICRIEELRKSPKGGVEVIVKCFYRRRDIPVNLIQLADRHAIQMDEELQQDALEMKSRAANEDSIYDGQEPEINMGESFWNSMSDVERHQLKHRELFLSRQLETYRIDAVRGKCSVTVLNELDSLRGFLKEQDRFYYSMVYDPFQKTLMVDKGEMRIGFRYQAEITPRLEDPFNDDTRDLSQLETSVWSPDVVSEAEMDKFLIIARSVGTFARALVDDSNNINRMPLRLGAATASRDITLFHAMDVFHKNNYDMSRAISGLVMKGRPIICCDELEAWTAEDANQFQQGLSEHKGFLYIKRKFFPQKSLKSVVSYYYLWKTTQQYQLQRRAKMAEKQNDLKEVIVQLIRGSGQQQQQLTTPTSLAGLASSHGALPTAIPKDIPTRASDGGLCCESCFALTSTKWQTWGDTNKGNRLCHLCYVYWRKNGGLKLPTAWECVEKQTQQIYTCTICNKQFNRQERLTNHMKQHQPFRCMISSCLKTFKSKSTFARHMSVSHPNSTASFQSLPTLMPPTTFLMEITCVTLHARSHISHSIITKLARAPHKALKLEHVIFPENPLPQKRRRGIKFKQLKSLIDIINYLSDQANIPPTSPAVPRMLLKGPLPSPSYSKSLSALSDIHGASKRQRNPSIDSLGPNTKQACTDDSMSTQNFSFIS